MTLPASRSIGAIAPQLGDRGEERLLHGLHTGTRASLPAAEDEYEVVLAVLDGAGLPVEALELVLDDEAAAVARVVRLASGTATADDHAAIARAARVWMDSNGDVAWERCLGLPTTPDAFRRMQRDAWLAKAAAHLEMPTEWNGSAWKAAAKLADEWSEFLSRGPWRDWRDDAEPPPWVTPFSRALFFASRLNRAASLGAREVHRRTRHVFEAKSQTRPLIL